jgi:hypothetical protein
MLVEKCMVFQIQRPDLQSKSVSPHASQSENLAVERDEVHMQKMEHRFWYGC